MAYDASHRSSDSITVAAAAVDHAVLLTTNGSDSMLDILSKASTPSTPLG